MTSLRPRASSIDNISNVVLLLWPFSFSIFRSFTLDFFDIHLSLTSCLIYRHRLDYHPSPPCLSSLLSTPSRQRNLSFGCRSSPSTSPSFTFFVWVLRHLFVSTSRHLSSSGLEHPRKTSHPSLRLRPPWFRLGQSPCIGRPSLIVSVNLSSPPLVVSFLRIPTSVRFSVIFDTRLSSSLDMLPFYLPSPFPPTSFPPLSFSISTFVFCLLALSIPVLRYFPIRIPTLSFPRLPVLCPSLQLFSSSGLVFRSCLPYLVLVVLSVSSYAVCRIVIRVFLVPRLSASIPSSLGIPVLLVYRIPDYSSILLRLSTTQPVVFLFVSTRPLS